jgi:hypothetical protein
VEQALKPARGRIAWPQPRHTTVASSALLGFPRTPRSIGRNKIPTTSSKRCGDVPHHVTPFLGRRLTLSSVGKRDESYGLRTRQERFTLNLNQGAAP